MAGHRGPNAAYDTLGSMLQRAAAARIKSAAARPAFGAEAVEIRHRLDRHAPAHAKELGEATRESVDIGPLPVTADKALIQHLLGGKADHLDQPVDDDSLPVNRQSSAAGQRQWHDPEIDTGR